MEMEQRRMQERTAMMWCLFRKLRNGLPCIFLSPFFYTDHGIVVIGGVAERTDEMLKRWVLQIALHGEVAESLPWRLEALDLHGVTLHFVPDRARRDHRNALERALQTVTVLKKNAEI